MRPDSDSPTPPTASGERYRFDDIVVDTAAHTLEQAGQPLAVEPKVFATLLVLLRHAGELVSRDDLLDIVWGHRHITPGVLTRAIAQLRDVLGDDAHHPRYIQTQHAVGYRFIGELIPDAPAPINNKPSPESLAPADAASSTVIPQSESATVPDGGHSHHGAAWRWSWSGVAVLVALLAVVTWLDRRSTQTQVAKHAEASIAVLPFTTLSDDQKDSYYAEGLSTEMHSALSEVPGIKVAAWLPPQAIDRRLDMKQLGQKLGVATVLDATVQREGFRIRISARLSGTSDGTTLWAHTYERDSKEIFATQSEIANEVATTLVGVLPDHGTALRKRLTPTRNLAAFDSYLQGVVELLDPASGDGTQSAIDHFNKALEGDSGFARAQAGVCRAEVRSFQNRNDAAAYDRAKTACERASRMQPNLGVVNIAMAEMHLFRGEYATANEFFTRAMADPASRPAAYVGIAIAESRQGLEKQALENFNKALELRPADPTVYSQLGYHYYLAGDLPKAIENYRKAIELQPNDVELMGYLGGIYLTAGRMAEARQVLARSLAIRPSYASLTNMAELEYFSGNYAKAVELNRRAVQVDSSDYVTWGNLGETLLAVPGQRDEATAAFRQAVMRAERYVAINPGDAQALALLGWYQANLGEGTAARALVERAEALRADTAEVALTNAQTLAALGEIDQAGMRINIARKAGIAEFRIKDNPALRRGNTTVSTGGAK